MTPRIRYKLTSESGEPIAEPAELVDPRTDCGNEWTPLTSKPVRRMQLLITACIFFGGSSLLSILLFLPWPNPSARIAAFVFWLGWTILTGIGFLASLVRWLTKEPELSLSRPCIRNKHPIALRWALPEGMKKRALKIELCGQEEWTRVFRGDTQVEMYRFLTLALVDLPEEVDQRDGAVFFRPPPLAPSYKENAHKIRYWISLRILPGALSGWEYEVTVQM